MNGARIAIPEPTMLDRDYSERNWPEYAHAVALLGGCPVLIPLGSAPHTQASLLSGCSGVLLPGSPADVDPQKYGESRIAACGAADAAREATDELLLQDAFNLHKPILGICYGLQSLNVWRGGSLVQDLISGVNHRPGREIQDAHQVEMKKESQLAVIAGMAGPLNEHWTNSSHHQAIAVVGDGLVPVAWSVPDSVVEAVEGTLGRFVLGVQWHPERTVDVDPLSRAIFSRLVEAANAWKPQTPSASA